jgi:hypothetical protein
VLDVQTLAHPAQFNVQVSLDSLDRNFLAPITDGKVDLAKSTHTDATLDRVSFERRASAGIGKVDGSFFHAATRFILVLVNHITI